MKITAMQKALKRIDEGEFYDPLLARIDLINTERKMYQQKALEKHFSENILPILALYLVFQDAGRENAYELSEKVANEMFGFGRKQMEFWGRLPFFFWIIEKFTPNLMQKMFPSEGWNIEWLEVSDKQVAFNMHGCFYHQALKDYNVPELTPVFCGLDDLIYENVSPYLRWERKGTIGRGDDLCDFRFINPKQE